MKIDWRKQFTFGSWWKKAWKIVCVSAIVLTMAMFWFDMYVSYSDLDGYYTDDGTFVSDESDYDDEYSDDCNVYGIELRGDISTYITEADPESEMTTDATASEDVVMVIEDGEANDNIKAMFLEVDSYGGYPVAGEEIALAIKNAKKPVIALIREGGASAAYMAASAADYIIASPNSDVGSIGVTMSYLENTRKNQMDGLDFISLTSGKFKDTGNSDKTLTTEEKALLMRDVNTIHQNFVNMVAQNRGLDVAVVEKLADGSTMLGQLALENGLIDELGGMPEARKYIEALIGEKPEICW